MPKLPKIFIAYARKDEALLNELRIHFAPLERSRRVEIWYDGKIEPGVVWEQAIKDQLHQADIILLLVSASAIASDYFYEKEVRDALQRHAAGTARVVPFILRPCAWKATQLFKLQALPKDGKPVTSWADRDAAYSDAVNRIWEMIKEHEDQQQALEEKRRKEAALLAENKRKQEAALALAAQQQKEQEAKAERQRLKAAKRAQQRQAIATQSNKLFKSPILWAILGLLLVGIIWFNSGGGDDTTTLTEVATNPVDTISRVVEEIQPSETYKQYLVDAQDLLNNGKFAEARTLFQKAQFYAESNQLDDSDAQKGVQNCEDEIKEEKTETRSNTTTNNNLPTIIQQLQKNMVSIPSGTFTMGCTSEQGNDCDDDEKPTRQVSISGFKMGKYEVTQEEWRAVMGSDPPDLRFKGCDRCPVESVSWNDAQDFIKKLNQMTGQRYRLPSEAEWEYAARGGQSYKYAGSNDINEVAWYSGNSNDKTHELGGKKKNGYGLYDMSGNVYEWCQDSWHSSYEGGPSTGKAWESSSGSSRVHRGGSWSSSAGSCRVSNRGSDSPDDRGYDLGFRLVLSQ
ncbi:MAG: SUMF1/EgtB/PvdO family nonheme iron enzyme [Bacteroidota bacterium]